MHDLTEHDQHLAFAVAQLIAGLRGGGTVRILGLPDVEDRVNPAVELLTVDAAVELAIEHTLIEPFEKEMDDRPRVLRYERELTERVAARLPGGSRFDLGVDVLATESIKLTSEGLDVIAAWIIDQAPQLEIGSPRTAPRHQISALPPSVPFPVTLYRCPLSAESELRTFAITVARPADLEVRRRARIARALKRKLPKRDRSSGRISAEVGAGAAANPASCAPAV